MKKMNKFAPLLLSLFLLAGCTKTPNLSKDVKDNTIVTDENITQKTYQQISDNFFTSTGVEETVKNLILNVAKTVLKDSTHINTTDAIKARLDEKYNEFYTSGTYKEKGLFQEKLLVSSLRSAGYTIVEPTGVELFEETLDTRVGYGNLKECLKADYSDWEKEMTKDIYLDLLNEEYILTVRAGENNTTYFTNKKVRKVQYFKYSPTNSSDANKFAEKFQDIVTKAIAEGKDLKAAIAGDEGIETLWKIQQLDELAKDFAKINRLASEGTAVNSKVATEDYYLPAVYADAVAASEAKYAHDEKYGYIDGYNKEAKYDVDEVNEFKSKRDTYSASDKHSIYEGYYEKQLAILTTNLLTEAVATTDNADIINSTVQTEIKDFDKIFGESSNYKAEMKGRYLDINDTDTCVFKADSDYYIVFAEKVEEGSASINEAAKELAKITSNVKNAVLYYLNDLTEKGILEIHNQEVYDYLNTTYSYGEKD